MYERKPIRTYFHLHTNNTWSCLHFYKLREFNSCLEEYPTQFAKNLGSDSNNVLWTPTELCNLTYKCTYEDNGTTFSKLFLHIQLESHLCDNKRVWVGQHGFESQQPHLLALGTWASFRLLESASNPRPPHGIMRIRWTSLLKWAIWYKRITYYKVVYIFYYDDDDEAKKW